MIVLLVLAAVQSADAAGRACQELRQQMASIGGGADGNLFQRYDKAVAEQRRELNLVRKRARSGGCGFALGFGNARCQAINVKIEQMESNLAELQATRSSLANAGQDANVDDGERRRLQLAMMENGCDVGGTQQSAELGRDAAQEGGLFSRLGRSGGSFEYVPPPGEGENVLRVPGGEPDDSGERYRTMCVRTCDGYYFPMSHSSLRDDFSRDQQNCESICPGAEMRTYYQQSGAPDVDGMLSTASEEPYSDLATSYLYRRADYERPPACGCGKLAVEQNYSIIAGEGSAAKDPAAVAFIPRPSQRPDVAADPETLANAEGGLDTLLIKDMMKPRATKLAPPGERKIRVVGPTFLPDPTVVKDPPVPAPTAIR